MESERRDISGQIIGAALKVHSALGPGLLESAYEQCLRRTLETMGFKVETQVPVTFMFDGIQITNAYRIDLLVDNEVVVELKAIERLLPLHHAQLRTYLRISNLHLGLLINFNTRHLRDQIERVVNNF
jgi:GxxExxY protein